MDESISNEVKTYSQSLTDMGIENEIVAHPDLKAISDVADYLGITLADTLPTMIMKADDRFLAIVRRGDSRLDFKKVKQAISKNIRMATAEEFTELTGLPLGTARVYTLGLKTYIDEQVFKKKYLMGGSGSFTCSVRYKTDDLRKLKDAEVVSVSQ